MTIFNVNNEEIDSLKYLIKSQQEKSDKIN